MEYGGVVASHEATAVYVAGNLAHRIHMARTDGQGQFVGDERWIGRGIDLVHAQRIDGKVHPCNQGFRDAFLTGEQ